MTQDELCGCHYRLEGHEFQQILGVCEGQGSLACSSLWGHKMSDPTEQQQHEEVALMISKSISALKCSDSLSILLKMLRLKHFITAIKATHINVV